jgi:hypothetical protein
MIFEELRQTVSALKARCQSGKFFTQPFCHLIVTSLTAIRNVR